MEQLRVQPSAGESLSPAGPVCPPHRRGDEAGRDEALSASAAVWRMEPSAGEQPAAADRWRQQLRLFLLQDSPKTTAAWR